MPVGWDDVENVDRSFDGRFPSYGRSSVMAARIHRGGVFYVRDEMFGILLKTSTTLVKHATMSLLSTQILFFVADCSKTEYWQLQ